MTRKTTVALLLCCSVAFAPAFASARGTRPIFKHVGDSAAKGAATTLAVAAGATLGALTLAGLTVWYFVHRRHAAESTATSLGESARLAATTVAGCVDDTGAPALGCW